MTSGCNPLCTVYFRKSSIFANFNVCFFDREITHRLQRGCRWGWSAVGVLQSIFRVSGYTSEAHIKLKSRKVSFASKIFIICRIDLKIAACLKNVYAYIRKFRCFLIEEITHPCLFKTKYGVSQLLQIPVFKDNCSCINSLFWCDCNETLPSKRFYNCACMYIMDERNCLARFKFNMSFG